MDLCLHVPVGKQAPVSSVIPFSGDLGPACVLVLAETVMLRDKEIRLRPRMKMVHA